MHRVTAVVSILVGIIHIYFCYVEMFRWTSPGSLEVFRMTAEQAEASVLLAANQGVYNLLLGLGIVWGALRSEKEGLALLRFLLLFAVLAGAYAALTVNPRIFMVQSVPALLAFVLTWVSHNKSPS